MNRHSSHRRIPMNKTEMIEAVASETGLAKTEVAKVLNAYTNAIVKTVAEGGEYTVIGFGKFMQASVKHAPAATLQPESKSRSRQLWFLSSLQARLSRTLLMHLRNRPVREEPKPRNSFFWYLETPEILRFSVI